MKEPRWITKAAVLLLHAQTLAEHGGLEGIRDEGALESALARPQNRFAYEDVSDPARLGAAYVFGIIRNHPFVDGNKRASFAALGVFLGKNVWRLVADQTDASDTILAAAAGRACRRDACRLDQQASSEDRNEGRRSVTTCHPATVLYLQDLHRQN